MLIYVSEINLPNALAFHTIITYFFYMTMNYTFGSPGNFFMESVTHFQNELFISIHFEFIRHDWLFFSMALFLSFWQSVDRKGASTDLQLFCLSSWNT